MFRPQPTLGERIKPTMTSSEPKSFGGGLFRPSRDPASTEGHGLLPGAVSQATRKGPQAVPISYLSCIGFIQHSYAKLLSNPTKLLGDLLILKAVAFFSQVVIK